MKQYIIVLFIALGAAACSSKYGEKIKKEYLEVYYKEGISKEEAVKVLGYLYPIWKDKGEETKTKSIQLTKNGDTINFRMVSNMEIIATMEEDVFYTTANEISKDVFNNRPVNVDLTDETFKTIRTFVFTKMTIPDYGEKVSSGNIEVYFTKSSNNEEARRLADYLANSINSENVISFQISNDEQGILLRMVSTPEKANTLQDSQFYDMAAEISKNVFKDAPVKFQLTDDKFNPFKTFDYKPEIPAPEGNNNQ